jgi:hypothetical protein
LTGWAGKKVAGPPRFGGNVRGLVFFPDAAGRWSVGVSGGVVLKKKYSASGILAIIPAR